jgi:hypothetical protein
MAIENINAIWKGLWAAHASPSSAVPPAITAADWDQKRKKYCSFVKPIADADAGTTYEWPFFSNLGTHSLVVTAATIVPFAALNRRLAAAAAVVIASRATTITDTGDWVALTPLTMTLSATAANRIIAPGEDLSLHLVDTGNGVAVPVLAITVEYFEL